MMQIEIIGCTGAGKSSLIQDVLKTRPPKHDRLVTSYDFVLAQAHLGWVQNHRMRMLFLNLITLLVCLLTCKKNYPFYRFMAGVIWRFPDKVSPLEKLKIARISARNVGIDEIIRRSKTEGQVVLADEGILHIAHYLFVHTTAEPDLKDLAAFIRLVPLPDVVVYVRQPESILVSRTMRRGHKRIPQDAAGLVQQFIQHGLVVFENLAAIPDLEDRLVIIDNGEALAPGWENVVLPKLVFAREIFTLRPAV